MTQYMLYLTITILGVSYATTTSPTDTNQQHPCNTCCQGPSGLPGIPGTGHNGLPGRDGLRGEKGESGQKGDFGLRGDTGPVGPIGLSGEKGERGPRGLQGLPGKIGPQGLKGSAGADAHGLPGGKGQKGELGQKGESGERLGKSAFTALKTSAQSGNSGELLTFDEVATNFGNDFDLETSKFTCHTPGVYWFSFTMGRSSSSDDPYVYLVKDGTNIVIARFWDNSSDHIYTQATHGAVLQLAAGEQVWIMFGSTGQQVYSNGAKYTSFSGFLLFET